MDKFLKMSDKEILEYCEKEGVICSDNLFKRLVTKRYPQFVSNLKQKSWKELFIEIVSKQTKEKETKEKEQNQKEKQTKTLTGIKDVDLLIMSELSDKELGKFCQLNSYTKGLCKDDNFWRRRTLKRFTQILEEETLIKNKEANFTSWRDYYINLVDFMEKVYSYYPIYREGDNFTIHSTSLPKPYIIKKGRDDLIKLEEIIYLRSRQLLNPEKVQSLLKEDFVNPNIFYNEDNEDNYSSTDPLTLENIKAVATDPRFNTFNTLEWLFDSYPGLYHNYEDDEIKIIREKYTNAIKNLLPYISVEDYLDAITKYIDEHMKIGRRDINDVILNFSKEKGISYEDILNIFAKYSKLK